MPCIILLCCLLLVIVLACFNTIYYFNHDPNFRRPPRSITACILDFRADIRWISHSILLEIFIVWWFWILLACELGPCLAGAMVLRLFAVVGGIGRGSGAVQWDRGLIGLISDGLHLKLWGLTLLDFCPIGSLCWRVDFPSLR